MVKRHKMRTKNEISYPMAERRLQGDVICQPGHCARWQAIWVVTATTSGR